MLKHSKKNFYNDAIKKNKSPNFLWKNLNNITCSSKSRQGLTTIPDIKKVENSNISGCPNILNELNKHFVNISNIIKKTALVTDHFTKLQLHINATLTSDITSEIRHINTFEVKKHLDSLNVKKSVGLDGIGPRILKYCGDYITSAISSIINNCSDKNIFPEILKHACVIPIHKGGDKNDPHNYRPISILPTLSKIFERHISNQLQDYFQRNNLISVRFPKESLMSHGVDIPHRFLVKRH